MANLFSLFGFIRKKNVPYGTVTYEVSGTPGNFNVTFTSANKKTQQLPQVKNGWQYSFIGNPGDYFYVSAQANKRNAKVNVRAYQNGKLLKEYSRKGDYVLATISGMVPASAP